MTDTLDLPAPPPTRRELYHVILARSREGRMAWKSCGGSHFTHDALLGNRSARLTVHFNDILPKLEIEHEGLKWKIRVFRLYRWLRGDYKRRIRETQPGLFRELMDCLNRTPEPGPSQRRVRRRPF